MSVIDELEELKKLKEQGILTETEFESEKNKILNKGTKAEKNNVKTEKNLEKIETNTNNNTEKQKVKSLNKSVREQKKKNCKNCGNEIHEGEKFCGKCGTKVKNFKIKKYQIVIAISIVILLAIGGVIGGAYYNNTVITDEFLTENLKQNGFEQFDNVNVTTLAIKDITYDDYNKLVVANIDVSNSSTKVLRTSILLVNKKENKVNSFTINNSLLYLLKGIANSNTADNPSKIAEICVKYIQNKGTSCFNNTSDDFKNLVKEIGNIVGTEKSRNFIKTEYAKVVSNANISLDYTILFEKNSVLIKYIAFYETSVEFNPKYPMSEKTYKLAFGDYSDKSSRQTLEYLYGPPYITVKKYNVYEIGAEYSNEQEFEDTKVGSYNTLEEAKEQLNVEE